MKTLLSTLFLLSASALLAGTGISTPASAPVSDDVLLSAIAAVETGNNPSRLGHYGERTQLQILPETWREFSRLPHSRAAANPAETERVARAYLQVIRHRLEARGLPQTPYYIAAGWNAGPGFRRLSPGTVSYAKRVANVVEMELALEARAAVAAAPGASDPSADSARCRLEAERPGHRAGYPGAGELHGAARRVRRPPAVPDGLQLSLSAAVLSTAAFLCPDAGRALRCVPRAIGCERAGQTKRSNSHKKHEKLDRHAARFRAPIGA
jgi:hypothetical protein